MYVRYGGIHGHQPRARYVCVDQADARRAACQSVPASDVDAPAARLGLELMTPMAIEMTLAIQDELDRRVAQREQHHQLRVTRARYESDFARRRFMLVHPKLAQRPLHQGPDRQRSKGSHPARPS
jgi:hypothetical protein